MTRLTLTLALVLVAATAQAEPFNWKPATAFAAGQLFDVWTTTRALERGCVEGNALYGARTPSAGHLMAGKAITLAPVAVAATVLHAKGHRKIAAALGYGGGAVGVSIGALNLARTCGGAR